MREKDHYCSRMDIAIQAAKAVNLKKSILIHILNKSPDEKIKELEDKLETEIAKFYAMQKGNFKPNTKSGQEMQQESCKGETIMEMLKRR